ncbi:MAG: hypothetical protein FJ303_23745 [Planctomycetes bacterium]|nr:hypothetical protein [Planctomycetota bacterium]
MTNKDVADAKRSAKKWLDYPLNKRTLHDEPTKEIIEGIAYVIKHDLRISRVFLKMQLLSSWHGMHAIYDLLNDNPAGWRHLHASFLYRVWHARINGGYQDAGYSKAVFDIWEMGLGFAHSIAVREDGFMDWQGQEFLNSLAGKNNKYRGWEERCFEVFSVALYAMFRNKAMNFAEGLAVPLGVYQEVFDSWHDPIGLGRALVNVCEHHWVETNDLEDLGHVGAFSWAPYSIFPVEMLAIRRIREEAGLPMPDIEHPLMKTLFAAPPREMPVVHEEALTCIVERARAEGVAGIPW